jgi:hypothetical protein
MDFNLLWLVINLFGIFTSVFTRGKIAYALLTINIIGLFLTILSMLANLLNES